MKIRKRATATLIILLLISGPAYGQFFEDQQEQDAPFSDNSSYFDGSGPNYDQPDYGTDDGPEYGTDAGPGNPGSHVPIDDWLFLLPLAGAAVGAYFLRRRRRQKIY
ncbi:MAG: hypothetical protein WBF83_03250 [Moheibacter sp.]